MKKLSSLIICLLATICSYATSYQFDSTTVMLVGGQGNLTNLVPGDTIQLLPGKYSHLRLLNIKGTKENPIIIQNHPSGKVNIASTHYFGISFTSCEYIKLLGTGSPQHQYGINIEQVEGTGIGATHGTYGLTISNVYIHDIAGAGIQVKTDATCSEYSRDSLILYDILIYNNKIERVGLEGFYLGSTKYSGRQVTCDSITKTLYDPVLQHVRVYNNQISYTGWDGLQVAGAFDVSIFNNDIHHDSQANVPIQMSGIAIGAGCIPIIYNNYIANGKGNGISSFGLSGQRIYNNIIIKPGKADTGITGGHGIYISDKENPTPTGYSYLVNNTIIKPYVGIKIQHAYIDSSKFVVANNLIVEPSSYSFYDSIQQIERAFVHATGNKVSSFSNVVSQEYNTSWFEQKLGIPYAPAFASPVVDGGSNKVFLFNTRDYFDNPRLQGFRPDAGAIESAYFYSGISTPANQYNFYYDNPIKNNLWFWKFRNFEGTDVAIQLIDLSGKIIKLWQKPIQNSDQSFTLRVPSSVDSGIYVVQVTTKNLNKSALVLIP